VSPVASTGRSRHQFGFWAATFVFLAVLAFSTAPSPLYVLYARRDHFSSLMITVIYAAYAIGVLLALFFVSHLSDVHGRRSHLLGAVALAETSAVIFIVWPSLAGLFLARVLCGLSVGLTVSTATAYLNELHLAHKPAASTVGRPQLAATAANLGGLAIGAFVTGLLAQYEPDPLVLSYVVLLIALLAGGVALAASPETRRRPRPLPRYRLQRVSLPREARVQYAAAVVGVFVAYAGPAIFIGLAGTFLAEVVHDTSLAMAGLSIFIVFTVGVALLVATSTWPVRRLLIVGVILDVVGLGLVVVAAWLPKPSIDLFLAGGGVVGAAAAALFKGTLGIIVVISPAKKLGESLSGFFLSGYVGLSLPVVGVGIALQYATPRSVLLGFAVAATLSILGCAKFLIQVRPSASVHEALDPIQS
jgi:MFS family permease